VTTRRILVVDDSVLTLDITRTALEEAGFEVATACNFPELETQDPTQFDLILMDVQMPELYGDDVAAVIRHVRQARARIVLFSNLPADELAARATAAGLDGYVCKRDGMGTLIARVREALA
jgi:DNA-binding response OmpR family regulator